MPLCSILSYKVQREVSLLSLSNTISFYHIFLISVHWVRYIVFDSFFKDWSQEDYFANIMKQEFFSFSSRYSDFWIVSDDEFIQMSYQTNINSFNNSSKSSIIETLQNRIQKLKRINSNSIRHIIEQSREISILISKEMRNFRFFTALRSITSIREKKNKIKVNFFSIYNLNIDVKLWILKIENFFYLQNILDSLLQATCAISYFSDILKRRTQRLKLIENTQSFSNWQNLQTWLTTNYDRQSAKLNADLIMKKIIMKTKKRIHEFIIKFETIMTNLNWNELTVCSIFRKKLSKNILDTIHLLHSKNWSETFVAFKTLAQNAENYLRIEKRAYENNYDDMKVRKRVRFSESKTYKTNQNKIAEWLNRHQKNYAMKRERRRRKKKQFVLELWKKKTLSEEF